MGVFGGFGARLSAKRHEPETKHIEAREDGDEGCQDEEKRAFVKSSAEDFVFAVEAAERRKAGDG